MKILILIFVLNIVFTHITLSQNSIVKINSYDIETTLKLNSVSIGVTALCQIQTSDSVSSIQFIFSSESYISSVEYLQEGNWLNIPFDFNGKDSLLLVFDNGALPANIYWLKFKYSFPTDILNDTLIIIDKGHRWYPLIPDQIATFKLICNVPENYNVLAAGNLQSVNYLKDNNTFIWESQSAVFKMPLIVFNSSKYNRAKYDSLDISVDFYYLNADSIDASTIIKEVVKTINYYAENIGSYSYNKLTLFEVTQWQGINTGSGLIMIGTQSLEMMKRKYYDGLHLTIAQQWIGAGVFAKYGDTGFWFLSLSLPHYLRLMYLQQTQGYESFHESLQDPIAKYNEFAGKENDIPIIDIDSPNSKEKSLILYGKGPFVLNIIKNKMGGDKWLSFLRNLYKSFRGKILLYKEFENYISKYDENGSIVLLLNQLVTQTGMPEE
ncbi:MAG TPA: hypothetical protein PLT92_09405 [Ignavibacteriaceae bacterium]|nr:hypothetical protein [Ignavibacteriaceae bacterium]